MSTPGGGSSSAALLLLSIPGLGLQVAHQGQPVSAQGSASNQPFHSLEELAFLCFFFPWGGHRPQADPASDRQDKALFLELLCLGNLMKILLPYRKITFSRFL